LLDWQDWRRKISSRSADQGSRWRFIFAVAIVFAYGWLFAVGLEPRFEPKPSVASSLAWIEDGELKEWSEIRSHRGLAFGIVSKILVDLDHKLAALGGFSEAPALVIDADSPERYAVSDTSIEISETIATADGQLIKAYLKSWLLQRATPEARDSLFRLEVLSDLLAAALSADPSFEAPGMGLRMNFPEVQSWLKSAASMASLCGSPWATLELQGRCGNSESISLLAFRPLVAAMIWQMYDAVPTWQRLPVLRAWAEVLRSGAITPSAPVASPFPAGWRDRLRAEFQALFPIEQIARTARLSSDAYENLAFVRTQIENAAEVSGRTSARTDFVFRGDDDNLKAVSRVKSHLIIDRQGFGRLFPGGATLSGLEMKSLQSSLLVRETCDKRVTLGELLDEPIRSKKLLFILSCADAEQMALGWSVLSYGGLGEFSHRRVDAAFVQFNLSQVEFAIRKGVLSRDTRVFEILERKGNRFLGLEEGVWRKDVGAYRVIGVIEAVEWVRPISKGAQMVSSTQY
jgi:hypothetical protein